MPLQNSIQHLQYVSPHRWSAKLSPHIITMQTRTHLLLLWNCLCGICFKIKKFSFLHPWIISKYLQISVAVIIKKFFATFDVSLCLKKNSRIANLLLENFRFYIATSLWMVYLPSCTTGLGCVNAIFLFRQFRLEKKTKLRMCVLYQNRRKVSRFSPFNEIAFVFADNLLPPNGTHCKSALPFSSCRSYFKYHWQSRAITRKPASTQGISFNLCGRRQRGKQVVRTKALLE